MIDVPESVILRMHGARVDTIESFSDTWTPGLNGAIEPENYPAISRYLASIKELCEMSNLKGTPIYANLADRAEAYYRIPIADQEMTDKGFKHRATSECLEGYTRVLKDIREPRQRGENQHISKFSYFNMMGELHNRRPFILASGYVGLGPSCLQVGDLICIFFGAKLPYILRKAE
jgi:hypothetical protein